MSNELTTEEIQLKQEDISLLINEYLKDKSHLRNPNDSIGIHEGLITYWDFANIEKPSAEVLLSLINSIDVREAQNSLNKEKLNFLTETDFKVLRHIRQKALGVECSLSDEDYLQLETDRDTAASLIVRN